MHTSSDRPILWHPTRPRSPHNTTAVHYASCYPTHLSVTIHPSGFVTQLALKLVDKMAATTTTSTTKNAPRSAMHVICALLSSRSEVGIKDLTTMQVVTVHFILMLAGEEVLAG